MNRPLTKNPATPGPCRATAQCGVRCPHDPVLGGVTWQSARLAPTKPLQWRHESGFRAVWRPQKPSAGSRIQLSGHLVPTKPVQWRHESWFRAVWRPQNPSAGSQIRVFGHLVPTKPVQWRHESGFRAVWRPQNPSAGSRIQLSGHLVPTKPLQWRHESEFRVAWRPQNPSGGDANRRSAPCGTHTNPRLRGRKRGDRADWRPRNASGRGDRLCRANRGDVGGARAQRVGGTRDSVSPGSSRGPRDGEGPRPVHSSAAGKPGHDGLDSSMRQFVPDLSR